MRLEPWRQESESRPPAPRHQPRPLCSHSQRAEALRVRRLKSPSNESGPDKVPIMREFQHASPGRESGDCPVFLQSSTIEEAEGADAWRVTPVSRGRRASQAQPQRAAGEEGAAHHFGSSDWNRCSVSLLPKSSLIVGHTCRRNWTETLPKCSPGTKWRQKWNKNEVPTSHHPHTVIPKPS